MGEAEAGKPSSLIGQLTAFAGLATGAVTIVYGAGAAVYWAALNNRDVPSNLAIATSLPREFLIGTGLLYVALPIALTALLLFALTPILVKAADWGERILGGVLLAGGAGLVWAVQPDSTLEFVGVLLGALVTVFILTWLLATLVTERNAYQARDQQKELRRQELREKELLALSDERDLGTEKRKELEKLEMLRLERDASRAAHRQVRTYLAGLGLLSVIAWGIFIGIARTDLPPAKLCTTDGGEYAGFLIGETNARVYLGEATSVEEGAGGAKAETLPSQIISTPTAGVAKLFVGSSQAPCKRRKVARP